MFVNMRFICRGLSTSECFSRSQYERVVWVCTRVDEPGFVLRDVLSWVVVLDTDG